MARKSDVSGKPIRIAVSACLLGKKVRYDGGHRHERYLTDVLGQSLDLVPVCPEVEAGLSVPRDPLRLARHGDNVRLLSTTTGRSITHRMRTSANSRASSLDKEQISGCVLKSKSPSCGLRVRTYTSGKASAKSATGLFAKALLRRLPNLPVIEERQLWDLRLRENWIRRAFAYRRLRDFFSTGWRIGNLITFHTAQKYLLLSHSSEAYLELGQLISAAEFTPKRKLRQLYEAEFMAAMSKTATPARHTGVLKRMFAFFKQDLDEVSRRELLQQIKAYQRGELPLLAPLYMVRHYARLLEVAYLFEQSYLNPHPVELAICNHA